MGKDWEAGVGVVLGAFRSHLPRSGRGLSSQEAGEHLVGGNIPAASWIARTCGMSVTSAHDRLRVGTQLDSLPKVAAALSSGEISYQSVSVLCHLRDRLGEKRDLFNEDEMLELARQNSVFNLRFLCRPAWHVANPDGPKRA